MLACRLYLFKGGGGSKACGGGGGGVAFLGAYAVGIGGVGVYPGDVAAGPDGGSGCGGLGIRA